MSTTSAAPDRLRRAAAEAFGTLLLVAGVVGSGIMAQRLTQDMALALLCNAIATGCLLTVLILIFAPVSGAHFNPAVTLALCARREIPVRDALLYTAAQIAGGIAGTLLAHAMFALPLFAAGTTARTRRRSMAGGSGRDLRPAADDFAAAPAAPVVTAGCGRPLHYGRLLVYCIHVVRQSRGDDRARADAHLRGHSPGRRADVYRGAIGRRLARRGLRPLVVRGA